MIKENRRTTVGEITLILGISYRSVTMKLRTRRMRGIIINEKFLRRWDQKACISLQNMRQTRQAMYVRGLEL